MDDYCHHDGVRYTGACIAHNAAEQSGHPLAALVLSLLTAVAVVALVVVIANRRGRSDQDGTA